MGLFVEIRAGTAAQIGFLHLREFLVDAALTGKKGVVRLGWNFHAIKQRERCRERLITPVSVPMMADCPGTERLAIDCLVRDDEYVRVAGESELGLDVRAIDFTEQPREREEFVGGQNLVAEHQDMMPPEQGKHFIEGWSRRQSAHVETLHRAADML